MWILLAEIRLWILYTEIEEIEADLSSGMISLPQHAMDTFSDRNAGPFPSIFLYYLWQCEGLMVCTDVMLEFCSLSGALAGPGKCSRVTVSHCWRSIAHHCVVVLLCLFLFAVISRIQPFSGEFLFEMIYQLALLLN